MAYLGNALEKVNKESNKMPTDHRKEIKKAILEGDIIEANDWTINISSDDEVEIWPPKGAGFATELSNLDGAVADFCRKAEIPVPGINEQQPDAVSLSNDMLDKDSETDKSLGKEPSEINDQVDPLDQPNSEVSDPKLTKDTEQKNPSGSDPTINKRPRSDDYGFSDPDLDPDTSMRLMKSRKIVDSFEKDDEVPTIYRELRAKRPSQDLLDGIMDPEGWAAQRFFKGAQGIDYDPSINKQQPDAIDVDDPVDMAGTYDRKKEIDEKALPEYKTSKKRKRSQENDVTDEFLKLLEGSGVDSSDLDELKDYAWYLVQEGNLSPGFIDWKAVSRRVGNSKKRKRSQMSESALETYKNLVALAMDMAGGDEVKAQQILDDYLHEAIEEASQGGSRSAKAPPGEKWERLVKKLKDDPDVENPYAVAWAQYRETTGKDSRKKSMTETPTKGGGLIIEDENTGLAFIFSGGTGVRVVSNDDGREIDYFSFMERPTIDELRERVEEYIVEFEVEMDKFALRDQEIGNDIYEIEPQEEPGKNLNIGEDPSDPSDFVERREEFGIEARKKAGPKLREKWMQDGGYARDIEAETAEELHNLTRAFGGDEVDWSALKPKKPEEQEAEERLADEVVARKVQGESSNLYQDLGYDAPFAYVPFYDKKGSGDDSDKEAVDEKAKKYWSDYYKEYGEQLTRGDVTKKKDKKKDKRESRRVKAEFQLPDDFVGTISEGTLNQEDILRKIIRAIDGIVDEGHQIWVYIDEYEATKDPEDQDFIFEDIWNELEHMAPEGTYFGGHEGDPADIGFWYYDEDEDEEELDNLEDLENVLEARASRKAQEQPVPPEDQALPAEPAAPAAPKVPATPKKPAPKAPTTPAPGTGDSGLMALGWTKEDIQGMSPEDKQKILQIQLNKPGTKPVEPVKPAPTPPAEPAIPAAPVTPKTPQSVPTMPGQQKQPPVASKLGQQMMEQPVDMTSIEEVESPDQQAFRILSEVQEMEVGVVSPIQVKTEKASMLAERLMKEVGITIDDAKEKFGVKNLVDLFK